MVKYRGIASSVPDEVYCWIIWTINKEEVQNHVQNGIWTLFTVFDLQMGQVSIKLRNTAVDQKSDCLQTFGLSYIQTG